MRFEIHWEIGEIEREIEHDLLLNQPPPASNVLRQQQQQQQTEETKGMSKTINYMHTNQVVQYITCNITCYKFKLKLFNEIFRWLDIVYDTYT